MEEKLRKFILDHIDSIAQLEILCLMMSKKDQFLSAAQMSEELRSTPSAVESQARSLVRLRLVKESERKFKFSPSDSEIEKLARELEQAYRERKVTVTQLIYEKPSERLKTFADAFKIKGES